MKNTKEFYCNSNYIGYKINNLYHGLTLINYGIEKKSNYFIDYKNQWVALNSGRAVNSGRVSINL